jgi:peptide/nickel transport system ATP-binding protein
MTMIAPATDAVASPPNPTGPLLEARNLRKRFANGVVAADDVSLTVGYGETLGIVGESGCGKSTTAKLILRLLQPDAGSVHFEGVDLLKLRGRALRAARAKLQLVPQNPQTSLNPRLSIAESIAFNMRAHGAHKATALKQVMPLLDRVGIPTSYMTKYPHELSGGQLQRVAIARALATNPALVVCDEAVSALDKSVQAQVLNLLSDLQRESNVAFLFISHDLAVVEHISDRVMVMYLGRVVEEAPVRGLWDRAGHPYTTALLSSEPGYDGPAVTIEGDLPNPADPPSGCVFRTRCPVALPVCADARPQAVEVGPDHHVHCVRAEAPLDLTACR